MKPTEAKAPNDYRYAVVSRRIWNDRAFRALSPLPPCGQALVLRLLSSPEASPIPGLIPTGRAALAEALSWPLDAFDQAIGEAILQGMAKADWEARLVWLPKSFKHNKPASTNQVRGWVRAFNDIPDSPLKDEAREALRVLCVSLGKPWVSAFNGDKSRSGKAKSMPSGMPSPEAKLKASPKARGIQTHTQTQTLNHTPTPTPSAPGDAPVGDTHEGLPEKTKPTPAERMDLDLATSSADSKLMDLLPPAFERAWHSVTGKRLGVRVRHERDRSRDLLEWARSVDASDPAAVVERAARVAAADPACVGAGSPWAWFCAKPGKYLVCEPVASTDPLALANEAVRRARTAYEAAGPEDDHRALRSALDAAKRTLAAENAKLRGAA